MQSKSKIVLSKHTCCALSCRVARYMESHPARVRESKCGKCDYLGNPNVASHAGARIETFQRHVHAVLFWSRALRGCANRNGKAKAAKTISGLRTSRGCANRNGIYCRGRDVAPHAGARIEIARFPVAPCFLPSHSVRVRESKCPAPENAKGLLPSHPARVRESKSGKCDYFGNPNVAPHAGARIKTPRGFLSLCVRWVAPCTGARIEIRSGCSRL